ncbi:MAG: HPF/RaiA family ribosome-associated protein, partial [Ruminococcaceae bacterium]|nr:HPF/RaiA family ribosome-associated protein [Oscillospiraceae bacterium]
GMLLRSEEKNLTFLCALDECVEIIDGQIRKNKTRLEKRMKSGMVIPKDDIDDIEEEGEFNIRTKTFPMRPMTPEEAILQMNLLGHTFFMFANAESGDICVVYKRKDNDYGMITPA